MEHTAHTLFYFPTTVLFIDDDSAFLSNIGFEIDKKIPIQTCNNPREVLSLLTNKPSVKDVVQKLISHWGRDSIDLPVNWLMNVDVKNLHRELYNPNRFSCISTLVIDYSMPGLNGKELCELLRDNPVKKIMLTGSADHDTAVQLFNSGLIDHFIVKDSPQMASQLNIAISKAQIAYFAEACAPLIQSMPQDQSCLRSSAFWKHLNQLIIGHNISEYYLIDDSGSFVLVDFSGNPKWLVVKSVNEIEGYYDIAAEHGASEEILQSLARNEVIPFFFTEVDQGAPVSEWDRYVHRAQPLPELSGHYYAILNEHDGLDMSSIVSHRDCLTG